MPITTDPGGSGGNTSTVDAEVSQEVPPGDTAKAVKVDVFLNVAPGPLQLDGVPIPAGHLVGVRAYRWCDLTISKNAPAQLQFKVKNTAVLTAPAPFVMVAASFSEKDCGLRICDVQWDWILPDSTSGLSERFERFAYTIEDMRSMMEELAGTLKLKPKP